MSRFHRLLGALSIALFLPALAAAQDRDAQEVQKYVLTDAGLAKYSQATREMVMLPGEETGACEDDDSDSQSIDQAAARLDSFPAAKNAIQSAGMSTREYIVFSFALLQTGLAVWGGEQAGGKLPPGISQANVDFYQRNDVQLKKLSSLTTFKDCDDEDEFEEEEEVEDQ